MIAAFNRSHYESVLVERVHQLVPKEVWKRRYDEINDFERLLWRDNNTTILKFFLHISKDEQLARFEQRIDDPWKNWKISEADYTERRYWNDYVDAYEEALTNTSTFYAPWFVIPSNHKWFCHLAVAQIIFDAMDAMKIKVPKPSVNLQDIRRKYHSEAAKEKSKKS